MSHVVTIEMEIYDLEALAVAAKDCGCELRLGQQEFRWYGRHVGDYPLPVGFTQADMGKCEHAISPLGNSNGYELGVVTRRDGKKGYMLMYDFYAGGKGTSKLVGSRAERLQQAYATEVARKKLRRRGFSVRKQCDEQGQVVLVGTKM